MTESTAAATADRGSLFTGGFSTYSVKDVDAAREFYSDTLGLGVVDQMGGLRLEIPNGESLFLYPKQDHEPATFTVFNLRVNDIEAAVDELTKRGVGFLQYGGDIATDSKGIFWGSKEQQGPNIAWFTDPSGNILSLIEDGETE